MTAPLFTGNISRVRGAGTDGEVVSPLTICPTEKIEQKKKQILIQISMPRQTPAGLSLLEGTQWRTSQVESITQQ